MGGGAAAAAAGGARGRGAMRTLPATQAAPISDELSEVKDCQEGRGPSRAMDPGEDAGPG